MRRLRLSDPWRFGRLEERREKLRSVVTKVMFPHYETRRGLWNAILHIDFGRAGLLD